MTHRCDLSRFIRYVLLGLLFVSDSQARVAAGVGSRSAAERSTYVDADTGVGVTCLTSSPAQDDKIYQTHPNWTADGAYLIFHSDRTGTGEIFALEVATGEIVQITDKDSGAIVVARHSNALYLVRDNTVWIVDLQALLADSKKGAMKRPDQYRRKVSRLPAGQQVSGTFTEDADGKELYFGLVDSTERNSIQKLDLAAGTFSKMLDVDFRVGHCQAHPTRTGLISYCQESGGDTAQRMWITHGDGTGNRPFYVETYGEWVTHEVWWTDDRMLFAIWPKNEQMRSKPYGIASVSLTDFSHKILSQFHYWHVCGTTDGRFAVGDTFEGELFLIDAQTGVRQLLTKGHRPDGAKSHQHQSISPDGKRVLFVSSRFGNWDLMSVDLPSTITLQRTAK